MASASAAAATNRPPDETGGGGNNDDALWDDDGGGGSGNGQFSDGLMHLLKPIIVQLDSHIQQTRSSQIALRTHIDSLAQGLISFLIVLYSSFFQISELYRQINRRHTISIFMLKSCKKRENESQS